MVIHGSVHALRATINLRSCGMNLTRSRPSTSQYPPQQKRLRNEVTFIFVLPPVLELALSMGADKRLTRSPWSEPILQAQRALLNMHAKTFTWKEQPLTLHNGHVVNMAIATSTTMTTTADKVARIMTAEQPSVLLLLHGWGAGLGCYARTLPHLVGSFDAVYLLDLPGMAASSRQPFPRHNRDAGLAYFLDDLDGAFAALLACDATFRHARRTLVGHSLGAYIAAEWLLRSAEGQFDRLMLVSPVGIPKRPDKLAPMRNPSWRVIRSLWAAGYTPQDALRVLPARAGRRLCARYIVARYGSAAASAEARLGQAERDVITDYVYGVSVAPGAAEYAISCLLTAGAWAVQPLCERLPLVDVPCAFLYGDHDWMDWRAGDAVRQHMPRATCLYRVANADHNVFIDNPEGFASALLEAMADFDQDGK